LNHQARDRRTEIESTLDRVEEFAGRKFRLRSEVAFLLECAPGKEEVFEQVTFFAKFLSKAYTVLRRSGSDAEEVARLAAEFGEKLGKTTSLIRILTAGAPGDSAQEFADRFLVQSQEGIGRLLELLYEVSWLKNYTMEKKRTS
jgi:hypothetical protein